MQGSTALFLCSSEYTPSSKRHRLVRISGTTPIGQVKIVDFVAENTFTIMMSHLLFVNIPNFIVYFQILRGSTAFSDFPAKDFVAGAWFRYSPSTRLAGFFCGLLGSLLVAWVINRVKERIAGLRHASH